MTHTTENLKNINEKKKSNNERSKLFIAVCIIRSLLGTHTDQMIWK